MNRRAIITAALALSVAAAAQAADLNAPIPTTPTLGSEIKRGFSVAQACSDRSQLGGQMFRCVDDASKANRARAVGGDDAFSLGLYFGGWYYANFALGAAARMSGMETYKADWQRQADGNWTLFRVYQKKLDLTDVQVVTAAGLNPAATDQLFAPWIARGQ